MNTPTFDAFLILDRDRTIPDHWEGTAENYDRTFSPGAAEGVIAVSKRYYMHYDVARTALLEFHSQQISTGGRSMYGLCRDAIRDEESPVAQFLKKYHQD